MLRGVGAFVILVIAGCGGASHRSPARPAAVVLGPAVQPDDPGWWKHRECPAGAEFHERWSGRSGEVWCATAGGTRHGPFAKWVRNGPARTETRGLYDRGVKQGEWLTASNGERRTAVYEHGAFIEMRQVLPGGDAHCPEGTKLVLRARARAQFSVCERADGTRHGRLYGHIGDFRVDGAYRDGAASGEWYYESKDRRTLIDLNKGDRYDAVFIGRGEWQSCATAKPTPRVARECGKSLPRVP